MSFKNKTIWITGASSGIGEALAYELANQDAKLILSARNTAKLETVKKQCKNSNKVQIIPLDLADYHAFDKTVASAIDCFGTIDVLVNNGGISQRSLIKDTSIEVDERLMTINYLGTVALTKALLPHFIKQQKGQFVVTTSIVGKVATPLRSSYAASKHALHGFFDSLRAEHYQDNLKVTLVCPGFVATDVSKNALTGDGSKQGTMDSATANGIQPSVFAQKMAKAIRQEKQEAYIGGAKEVFAVYVKRFFPKLLAKMIRKMAVT
jgi:short-subunit dehydrogenase